MYFQKGILNDGVIFDTYLCTSNDLPNPCKTTIYLGNSCAFDTQISCHSSSPVLRNREKVQVLLPGKCSGGLDSALIMLFWP